ncbi:MAG: hypothetical protein LBL99_00650 [Holosporaceae bacterium]|jgi:mevalonate kinase|nr:hypothetical protein [Holosporaceae bacterium]
MASNDSTLHFSAGSKTFLVGEYSVLFGGGAVVLVAPPNFELKARKGKTDLIGVEKNSSAYSFYESHDFDGLSIEFFDPHNGAGGFGASSAQFATLYKLYLELTRREFNVDSFLEEYKKLAGKKGVAPSGADCVAQYFNRDVFFDSETNSVEKIDWKFPNLDFAIFKTGIKVATHSHLQELSPIDVSELKNLTFGVKNSFRDLDEESLTKNTQAFFNALKDKGLVVDNTAKIVGDLLKIDGVKAAKGCGALCADAIIAIFEKTMRANVEKACDLLSTAGKFSPLLRKRGL